MIVRQIKQNSSSHSVSIEKNGRRSDKKVSQKPLRTIDPISLREYYFYKSERENRKELYQIKTIQNILTYSKTNGLLNMKGLRKCGLLDFKRKKRHKKGLSLDKVNLKEKMFDSKMESRSPSCESCRCGECGQANVKMQRLMKESRKKEIKFHQRKSTKMKFKKVAFGVLAVIKYKNTIKRVATRLKLKYQGKLKSKQDMKTPIRTPLMNRSSLAESRVDSSAMEENEESVDPVQRGARQLKRTLSQKFEFEPNFRLQQKLLCAKVEKESPPKRLLYVRDNNRRISKLLTHCIQANPRMSEAETRQSENKLPQVKGHEHKPLLSFAQTRSQSIQDLNQEMGKRNNRSSSREDLVKKYQHYIKVDERSRQRLMRQLQLKPGSCYSGDPKP